MSDIKQKIREKFTYHSDDGTSGYELSEEQFEKIDQIIDLAIAEERNTTLKEIEEEGIRVISTHEEGEELGYCDTGSDMELSCRSECVEMAVKRFKQLIHQKLI